MTPIKEDDIAALELKLTVFLPNSYKYLLSTYGLVHTPNVLTSVCDLGSDLSQVYDFLSPDDVYSLSKLYEMGGMEKGHILFASDCQGNMFCFKRADCIKQQIDLPVWFFNYDLCTINKLADSFIGWLNKFNQH